MGKPYHCGFFFKCWDQLFGSTYDGPCFCVKCEKKKGKRSRATFDKVVVPNYRKLLEARFWLRGGVLSGALSKDVNDEVIKSSVAGAGKDDLQESHKE